ncbi:hypothetical protein K457DRAFT_20883 [Linnemannia elongata AG-77]|uniref:Uncharacterized protein n=1 Tax=Linnemannia elongata AG-77 TaxID=1314771 RepID=A0A197JSE2_9FUNG|nr:hypothetical protein K457DRAFT_20883 [Linnemannia elongata AG-77]
MSLATIFTTTVTPASAAPGYHRGSDYFTSPTRYTAWNLGDTVEIHFNRALSREDSNSTMLYLEYTTRACRGSVPDEERYCDNRATKVTARGQIPPGADSFLWTIPTTLDLQLSRGQFHLYDYNGHSSESFLIRPASRRQQGVEQQQGGGGQGYARQQILGGLVDQDAMVYLDPSE